MIDTDSDFELCDAYNSILEWDDLFMSMAYLIAMKSHDNSTRVGAVIVGPDHEVRSMGYNGLPRGLSYNAHRIVSPTKYSYTEHAERNAIYNASRFGAPLLSCTLYTQWIPCSDCARAIVQTGIKEVVVHKAWETLIGDKWKESCTIGREILMECGVTITVHIHNKNISTTACLVNGGWYEV